MRLSPAYAWRNTRLVPAATLRLHINCCQVAPVLLEAGGHRLDKNHSGRARINVPEVARKDKTGEFGDRTGHLYASLVPPPTITNVGWGRRSFSLTPISASSNGRSMRFLISVASMMRFNPGSCLAQSFATKIGMVRTGHENEMIVFERSDRILTSRFSRSIAAKFRMGAAASDGVVSARSSVK